MSITMLAKDDDYYMTLWGVMKILPAHCMGGSGRYRSYKGFIIHAHSGVLRDDSSPAPRGGDLEVSSVSVEIPNTNIPITSIIDATFASIPEAIRYIDNLSAETFLASEGSGIVSSVL